MGDSAGGNLTAAVCQRAIDTKDFKVYKQILLYPALQSDYSKDTKYKSEILHSLGLNVNLAPVVDVSTNSNDYIYERTLKQDTNKVSEYVFIDVRGVFNSCETLATNSFLISSSFACSVIS